jgi:hypothetical protein
MSWVKKVAIVLYIFKLRQLLKMEAFQLSFVGVDKQATAHIYIKYHIRKVKKNIKVFYF